LFEKCGWILFKNVDGIVKNVGEYCLKIRMDIVLKMWMDIVLKCG